MRSNMFYLNEQAGGYFGPNMNISSGFNQNTMYNPNIIPNQYSYDNNYEQRITKLERQMRKLESRVSKLETNQDIINNSDTYMV